jgi:ketosteroid isomerase-like protein
MPKSSARPGALVAALLATTAGCNFNDTAEVDTEAAAAAVKSAERDMTQALKARDAARASTFYAADAAAIHPGEDPIEGNQPIGEFYSRMVADPAFAIDIANAKTVVAASGDLAYTRGTYRVTYTDPGSRQPVTQDGNYVTVFMKQTNGSWKIVEDISAPGLAAGAAAMEVG